MSLLSTFRPLGGTITVVGQSIQSLAGVVLAKCVFDSCTFLCNITGAKVTGTAEVRVSALLANSGSTVWSGTPIVASLTGSLTALFVNSVGASIVDGGGYPSYGWGMNCAVTLDGSTAVAVMTTSSYTSGTVNLTSNQTGAIVINANSQGGNVGVTLPNATTLTVNDVNALDPSSLSVDAPNATTATIGLAGIGGAVSINLGAATNPTINLPSSRQTLYDILNGPFTKSFVNGLLTAYAGIVPNGSSGSLAIGGASAAPTRYLPTTFQFTGQSDTPIGHTGGIVVNWDGGSSASIPYVETDTPNTLIAAVIAELIAELGGSDLGGGLVALGPTLMTGLNLSDSGDTPSGVGGSIASAGQTDNPDILTLVANGIAVTTNS